MRFRLKSPLVLAFLFGVLVVYMSPGDPDFGWHYRYGEYIVEHARILRANVFSYTFTDYRWANSYWIAQALLYLTHHYLGHVWAGLVFAVPLSALTLFYVYNLSKKFRLPGVLALFVSLLLLLEFSQNGITGRPMYFSSLFLMFLVSVLLMDDIKKFWWLPPLFLLWANMHADFVLGLFVLGLYVAENLLIKRKLAAAAVGLLSVSATLLNPFGFELWRTLLKESHPYQFNHISEWVPVASENLPYFLVYCAVLGLIVTALVGARHKLPFWYVLALGFFCIFAVRSQYFLRVAVIISAYVLLVFWAPYFNDIKKLLSIDLISRLRVGLNAFLLLSVFSAAALFATEIRESTDDNYWVERQGYPQQALDFAVAHGITGRVFNYYGWGGYIIWQYPEIKTFVDGRMPSWRAGGKSVFEDYINIVDAPDANINLLDNYNIRWIIYPTDSRFANYLKTSDRWQEVYSDNYAAVFVIIDL
ncbi:hypothetical protein KKG63_01475 [Patescibacteria group bacterium]|nr:hypothetical protein [Patescibacteria group bacterium]